MNLKDNVIASNRASDRLRKRKANFVGFSETNSRKKRLISREFRGNSRGKFCQKTIGKKQPIPQEFSGQISLESDRFCADLRNILNEKRWQVCRFVLGKMMSVGLCNNNSNRNTDYL